MKEMKEPKDIDRRNADRSDTVIGVGTSFSGDLVAAGPVRIDGECSGSVKAAGGVVVSAEARVKADIEGDFAVVAGRVEGNIRVDGDLRVVRGATILGNLDAQRIDMEEGSFVSGFLRIAGTRHADSRKGANS